MEPKQRNCKTVFAYIMFIALGMTNSVIGPTLVNMEVLLDTDTSTLGLALSSLGAGFLVGALLVGLIYDRLNSELQFALLSFIEGASILLAPFTSTVYLYIAAMFFLGLAKGYIDAAGSSYILMLWEGHRLKDSVMQALHFCFMIGSTFAPFAVSPFLTELMYSNINNTSALADPDNVTANLPEATEYYNSSIHVTSDISNVKYAYVLVGVCCSFGGVLFTALFIKNGLHIMEPKLKSNIHHEHVNIQSVTLCRKVIFLFMLFLFYFIHMCLEGIPGTYITIFVVKGFSWSVSFGATLTAIFFAANGIGRLISIPVSLHVSPEVIVGVDVVLILLAYILLLFVEQLGKSGMIASLCITGLALGPVFAGQMTWVAKYMPFTGVEASVCLMGSSVGKIGLFALCGFLLERFTHMSMVYMVLAGAILFVIIFILLYLYAKRYLLHIEEMEDNVKETKV